MALAVCFLLSLLDFSNSVYEQLLWETRGFRFDAENHLFYHLPAR